MRDLESDRRYIVEGKYMSVSATVALEYIDRAIEAERDREKLIERLRSIRKELDRRFRESDQKWERDGDMYEQGKSDAYGEADVLIRDILKECGVRQSELA